MAHIRILSDNIEADVPDGTPLIKICEDLGASLPFGCTEGFCGTCTMIVREGGENLSPPTEKERERLSDSGIKQEHLRLACQSILLKGALAFENG